MYSVIILAAGTGSRMGLGYNKMLYPLAGTPVIVRTVQRFKADPACCQIIVVANPEELQEISAIVGGVLLVAGGRERQDSVYQGLLAVSEEIVLVHDGARPFVSPEMIAGCLDFAAKQGAAVVGVPVKDTIKQVAKSGNVIQTLERSNLFAVQTPQAALTQLLKQSHEAAQKDGFLGTDEASLIEKYTDVPVMMVPGAYTNIKLTTPEDLLLAERILEGEKDADWTL